MTWNNSNAAKPDYSLFSQAQIKKIIILTRLSRYNQGIACGVKAIRQEMHNLGIQPLPSEYCIKQVLRENSLTYRRTGIY